MLLAALALVIVLLLVLILRPVQQQLIELRSRFDALIAAQQQVPRALAEGSAAQTQVLSDVRERLGQLGEVTKRLETVGGAVTEVQQLLQVPKLRGTIGEVWLEELLRQILPTAFYQMQYTFKSGERVDAVVRAGGRMVRWTPNFPSRHASGCWRRRATRPPASGARSFARSKPAWTRSPTSTFAPTKGPTSSR